MDIGVQKRAVNLPCPICGNSSYTWGHITASNFFFQDDDASFWDKLVAAGYKLIARRCNDCGNLQLFTNLPEASKKGQAG